MKPSLILAKHRVGTDARTILALEEFALLYAHFINESLGFPLESDSLEPALKEWEVSAPIDLSAMAAAKKEKIFSDKDHLTWIYNRLLHLHNENENVDYMLKFKSIIDSRE